MAIQQFYLQAIPFHDEKITIKEGINKIEQFHEVAKANWIKKRLNAKILIDLIDPIIPRSQWSYQSWKYDDGTVDNDVAIDVDNNMITSFSFRSDLTEDNLTFLKSMLLISRTFDLNLFTIEGDISSPPYTNIKSLIMKSRNFRYLSNPTEFIEKLDRRNRLILPYHILSEEE